jgi:hypothetical protein
VAIRDAIAWKEREISGSCKRRDQHEFFHSGARNGMSGWNNRPTG